MNLWAVTAYFNPRCYQARRVNYRCFRRHLGLPLLTVEWSTDGNFELKSNDADRLVQLQGGDLMWQKERLLGIASQHLPADCDAVLIIDADILLPAASWQERLALHLEQCAVVQPFQEVRHLPPLRDEQLEDSGLLPSLSVQTPFYLARQSFADRCLHGERASAQPTMALDLPPGQHREVERLTRRPSYGHAWAVRREWLDRIGIYEHCVAGSGDLAFAMAIVGRADDFCRSYPLNAPQQAHYRQWARGAAEAVGEGGLGRLDAVALHLFHGQLGKRNYRQRLTVLMQEGFDPGRDLEAAPGCPFAWASASAQTARIRSFFADYFRDRAEDEGRAIPGPNPFTAP